MEAIVLAGRFGTRLRPLTYTREKSLLHILNKPMISRIIDSVPKEVDKIKKEKILEINFPNYYTELPVKLIVVVCQLWFALISPKRTVT